jgi:hypothetical protein
MFHHQAGGDPRTGVGLLGAVTAQPSGTVFEYYMTSWDYLDGTVPVQGEHAFFRFVPEPPGLTLLAISAALYPRRR